MAEFEWRSPAVTFSHVKIDIWRVGWRCWMIGLDYTRTYPEPFASKIIHEWGGFASSKRQAMAKVGKLLSGRIPRRMYRLSESREEATDVV